MGIEPTMADLQSAALPLGYPARTAGDDRDAGLHRLASLYNGVLFDLVRLASASHRFLDQHGPTDHAQELREFRQLPRLERVDRAEAAEPCEVRGDELVGPETRR